MPSIDTQFAGSIPGLYDRYLGPLLFEPYAEELARRASTLRPKRILETAAGTGIVTDAMHRALPEAEVVATDLNPAMLEVAAGRVRSEKVRFQSADAQDLPFGDGEFDLVVCQFGLMFLPDKVRGNAEAWRVLGRGGHYIVAIWDRIDKNPASEAASDAVAALYPTDPPTFLRRTPFGYANPHRIEHDIRAGGFADVRIETVQLDGARVPPRDAATGLVAGCPLAAEVQERNPDGLEAAVEAAAEALKPLEQDGGLTRLSAHIVVATK
jgi:ubiquinone/menaquinone biosynthesis C-methylase UbiE